MLVRKASRQDLEQIASIYNQGIVARTATFETELRKPGDLSTWLNNQELLLVAERNAQVAAFARTSAYRERACYSGIREFSVYVDEKHLGHGLGMAVMQELVVQAKTAGLTKLISRIFKENAPSLALCDRLGFRRVGVYEKHGQLDGVWRDCVVVELLLIDEV